MVDFGDPRPVFAGDDVAVQQKVQQIAACILSAAICISFIIFKELRSNGFRLVFFLALSDMLLNLQFIVFTSYQPYGGDSALCKSQAVIKTFLINAGMFWTLTISLSLYSLIGDIEEKRPRLRRFVSSPVIYHAAVWGWASVCSLAPLFFGAYGISGAGSCGFVYNDSHARYFSIAFQWATIWATILATVTICTILRKRLLNLSGIYLMAQFTADGAASAPSAELARIMAVHDQLKWYPLILVVAWSVCSTFRMYQALTGRSFDSMPRWSVHIWILATGPSLQAIFNAVAYGLTPVVRKKWAKALQEGARGACFASAGCAAVRHGGGANADSPEGDSEGGFRSSVAGSVRRSISEAGRALASTLTVEENYASPHLRESHLLGTGAERRSSLAAAAAAAAGGSSVVELTSVYGPANGLALMAASPAKKAIASKPTA